MLLGKCPLSPNSSMIFVTQQAKHLGCAASEESFLPVDTKHKIKVNIHSIDLGHVMFMKTILPDVLWSVHTLWMNRGQLALSPLLSTGSACVSYLTPSLFVAWQWIYSHLSEHTGLKRGSAPCHD